MQVSTLLLLRLKGYYYDYYCFFMGVLNPPSGLGTIVVLILVY